MQENTEQALTWLPSHMSYICLVGQLLIQSSQVIAKAFVCVREFGESVV